MQIVTDRDIYNYSQCKYRVFQDNRREHPEETIVGDFMTMLWGIGVHDEASVVESIIKKGDKSYTIISSHKVTGADYAKRAQDTTKAMEEGVELIFGAVVYQEGKADLFEQAPGECAVIPLLSRMNGESKFGDYTYVPVLLQSGSAMLETDWGPRYHQGYLLRLGFMLRLLENVHGLPAERSFVRGSDGKPVAYTASSTDKYLLDAIGKVRLLIDGDRAGTAPVIGSMCDKCKWKDACKAQAVEDENVTLLFYAGEKVRDGFKELGIETISDLAAIDADELWTKVEAGIKRGLFYKSFDRELVASLSNRAKLYIAQKERPEEKVFQIRDNATPFPDSQTEVHYDIEDDPLNGFVYLHGFWIIEPGEEPRYEFFYAETEQDEEAIAQELWNFFDTYKDVPIYHYSGHERHTCKRLMDKYGLSAETFEAVFGTNGAAVDLYDWVVKYTDWPLTSYGLKPLCKYTGFTWSAEDAGGAQSIDWFYQYREGKTEMKEKILTYNKEDCMATAHLKNWLESHR